MRFYAVIFYTKNFTDMVDFYKDKLGLEVRMSDIENEFCEFILADNHILAILSDNSLKEMCGVESVSVSMQNQVLHGMVSKNVESDVKRLKGKGVEFFKDMKQTSWGQKVAYFKDPDGNIWEIGDDSIEN